MVVKHRVFPAALLAVIFCVGLLPLMRSQASPVRDELNAKVKPGDVVWHPNFAVACQASKRSGKPVLLFQLLGNLDEEFC